MGKILSSFLLILNLIVFTSQIDISITRGDKLFNQNTPIILNIASPDTTEKKSNVDLICVIDVSGSMQGQKIELVKQSLKTLSDMMDSEDRLGLVLFNNHGEKILDLTPLTEINKIMVHDKINHIEAMGGTNILSGLEIAVNMIKNEPKERISTSIILLSDGMDNQFNGEELANGLRQLTKNERLTFTLHTFGYGYDHDAIVMNKLALIRDGSFYFVEHLDKIKQYFVNVLGGAMSVISNKAIIKVKSNFKIEKAFGVENLYSFKLDNNYFETQLLQFIAGKEYTYVFEIFIPENTNYGTEIFKVELNYFDELGSENKQTSSLIYNEIKDSNLAKELIKKANEEYIRSTTYNIIQKALNEREKGNINEAKNTLKNMKSWLSDNYEGEGNYINDIKESMEAVAQDEAIYQTHGRNFMTSRVSEGEFKRGGSQMAYSNSIQKMMVQNLK